MANTYAGVVNETGGLIKRFYAEGIVDQLSELMVIYKMAEKVKDQGGGDAVYVNTRQKRNQGIGASDDGGALPAIGKPGFLQAKVDHKYNFMRCGITSGLIAASKTNKGAFAKGLDATIKYSTKDFMNDFNRQLSSDGVGVLATLAANAVASTTITLIGREGTNEPGNKFVDVDMNIDIFTAAGDLRASGLSIISVVGTNVATVVLDGPVTASATDIVVRSGSYNKEVQGLLYALDGTTSTIYSTINRALFPAFQGNVLNLNGAQLNLDQMQQAYNEGLRRGGTGNGIYQAALMDFDSSRFYQRLLTADKRYVNTMKLDGGAWQKERNTMEYNGVPVMVDKDFPVRIMFAPTEALRFYILNEMELANETGSNMIPSAENDVFELRFRMFGNLFNAAPAAFGVLRNYISP